ncbi:MAG: N-acetylmuramoyl-L-alanine amidase [Lachnospiraceae bacterium]|nr:N-acetylmuramoyl-L-alanine amidase [Lachnospiraceae bacterium]
MKKKTNRRDLPMTGILTAAVVVLLLVLALLVTGYRRIYDRGQTAAATSEEQTNAEEQTDSSGQTETETVIVLGDDDAETETESETETEPETNGYTVAIDPGHQGSWVDMTDTEPIGPGSSEMKAKSTTGTQGSYTGIPEYELNLEISLLLRTELEERGYEVILTREDNDTAISNAERATLAYEEGGDIYVRIHANGSENSSANGALGMVPSPSNPYVGDLSEESYRLAECILESYCSTAGFESLGVQYYDNMTGINWSKIPVMILEMGFMTNESDDLRMADPDVQELMVQGIADGIDAYFGEMES